MTAGPTIKERLFSSRKTLTAEADTLEARATNLHRRRQRRVLVGTSPASYKGLNEQASDLNQTAGAYRRVAAAPKLLRLFA